MAFASGSAFGVKPAGTGLFGSTFGQQQSNQPTTGAFGGFGQSQNTQNNATAQPTGGLFGQQPQQQQQQPQQSTGLFGQQTQNTGGLFGQQQQQQPSSLFGPSNQQQTQPTTGLFGQQQQQGLGGSLFGTANTTNATQQPQSNLFGNAATNQPGGPFGNTNTNQGAQGGLFGNMSMNTNQGGGLFGSNQPQATQQLGAFNMGGFGLAKQPSQAQSQLGIQASNVPVITKSTKFNDLPETMRAVMEAMDTHIQGRVQISKELNQRKLGEEPTKGHTSIKQMHKELIDIATTIRNDSHTTQDLKAKVEQAVEDTIVATRIVDGFRNPQSGNTYLKDHACFPLEYFTRIADQMRERLLWYKTTIEQIERKLSSSSAQTQTPQGIVATLQAQHATFLALASKTATLDAEVQKIKVYYTQLWRAKTGSVRDPFNDAVKQPENPDFGMSTLAVR